MIRIPHGSSKGQRHYTDFYVQRNRVVGIMSAACEYLRWHKKRNQLKPDGKFNPRRKGNFMEYNNFGDWLIFADETGDHGFGSAQTAFPVLAISFMLIRKKDYANLLVPKVKNFKHKYWGHDCVILHEREIRRMTGDFSFLTNPETKEKFMADLNFLISELPVYFNSIIIHKNAPENKLISEWLQNPYHRTFMYCLISTDLFLEDQGQLRKLTTIISEQRGKNEDNELRFGFDIFQSNLKRILNNQFNLNLRPKHANDEGLQIADLAVRPIAKLALNPLEPNRAIDMLRNKLVYTSYLTEHGLMSLIDNKWVKIR